MSDGPCFSIYYAGDAYSTDQKIMGRQVAGKTFLNGVARTWPCGLVHGLVHSVEGGETFVRQLKQDGFSGMLKSCVLPSWNTVLETGALYYPAPPSRDFAAKRNALNPAAFSIFGVTHTLSSMAAMDQVSDLLFPPFQPWDALICTSKASKTFVECLHDDMKAYWRQEIGATRFVDVELPIIPLGINAPAFNSTEQDRQAARAALGLSDEVVFLFSGRLSFHAKANPAPFYQALEKIAHGRAIACVEAGVFPNEGIKQAFARAQAALAPSVKFIWADGKDDAAYSNAWKAADVFVSLSENIQETFGLTPLEAMAAGLPVIVSDWSGYKDTVRDGVDGYRIPTILPPAGSSAHLARRYSLELDNYDFFIGRASMSTVVDPDAIAAIAAKLADDPALRRQMGAAAKKRAINEFDWPVILTRYQELAEQLKRVRLRHLDLAPITVPNRADPFRRFGHFSTLHLDGNWRVAPCIDLMARLKTLMSLTMANYAFDPVLMPQEILQEMAVFVAAKEEVRVESLIDLCGKDPSIATRCLMWLWKFDLVSIRPDGS